MSQELVKNMLNNIIDDQQAEAQENFMSIISTKLTDQLDARKIEIAQQLGANNAEVQAD